MSKIDEKIKKLRDKVAAKKSKNRKAKKTRKAATASALVAALGVAALCGCATSDPASRATSATYGDIIVKADNSSNVTVRVTLGDGAIASADSSGSTETMTATPTNTTDIKPDVDVNTTGGRTAGVLETAIAAGSSALVNAMTSDKTNESATTSSASAECADGSCEEK